MSAKEWTLADRRGLSKTGKQAQQIELTEVAMTMSTLISKFCDQLNLCRKHMAVVNWLNLHRQIDLAVIPRGKARGCTDFSATCDLRAAFTDNSSVDNHAVLDIFVVLHSRRKAEINLAGNMREEKNVCSCDVFLFLWCLYVKG